MPTFTQPAFARHWERLRHLPGRVPLRHKLITAVLALVAIALAVISIAGISLLTGYLLSPVDSQFPSTRQAGEIVQYHLTTGSRASVYQSSMTWLPKGGAPQRVITPIEGNPGTRPPNFGGPGPTALPGPAVPTSTRWLAAHTGQPTTLAARSGGGHWRVLVYSLQLPTQRGTVVSGFAVFGLDVTSQYQTLARLRDVDLVVSGIVLLGLAIVGVAIVRTSLRPLADIEHTAERIASGELSRRVPDRDPRTEVGRLGRSLNAMLSQIESAFHARTASESAARRSEERMRQFVADAGHELRTPLTAIRGYAEYYRQRGGMLNGQTPGGADTGETVTGAAAAADRPPEAGGAAAAAPEEPGAPRSEQTAVPVSAGTGGATLTKADMDRIMQRVEQESARMGVLVEDLLLLARLDQQRPIERRPVDMLTLAADAVQDARMIAPGRQIDLDVGSDGAFLVLGDEVRLRQVIANLMGNALTHTPAGTPVRVRISSGVLTAALSAPPPGSADTAAYPAVPPRAPAQGTPPGTDTPAPETPGTQIPPPGASPEPATPVGPQASEPAAGWVSGSTGPSTAAEPGTGSGVVLEVADQGPGLTAEQAEHVFERFYRADQARNRKRGGTGLGLAIVAALVAAHGGTVAVETAPKQGATFRITLPLAPEARHA